MQFIELPVEVPPEIVQEINSKRSSPPLDGIVEHHVLVIAQHILHEIEGKSLSDILAMDSEDISVQHWLMPEGESWKNHPSFDAHEALYRTMVYLGFRRVSSRLTIPDGVGHLRVTDEITFHYEKGHVYCVQIDAPLHMEDSFVGELGGNVYLLADPEVNEDE